MKRLRQEVFVNKITNVLIFTLLGVFLSGCGKQFTGLNWNFRDKTTLDINEIDFGYFSAKARIKFKDNKYDLKAKANIRIKKDSLIWLNFTAVGISGGRCLISRNSVTLINIVKKECYVFSYEDLSDKFNYQMNFDVIQAVILGNMPKKINSTDKVSRNEDYYQVLLLNNPYLLECRINTRTMKLESVDISEQESDNNAQINYSNFRLINDHDHAFAHKAMVSLVYKVKDDKINTTIDIEYIKAQIEEKELKFPFHIPGKYVRL